MASHTPPIADPAPTTGATPQLLSWGVKPASSPSSAGSPRRVTFNKISNEVQVFDLEEPTTAIRRSYSDSTDRYAALHRRFVESKASKRSPLSMSPEDVVAVDDAEFAEQERQLLAIFGGGACRTKAVDAQALHDATQREDAKEAATTTTASHQIVRSQSDSQHDRPSPSLDQKQAPQPPLQSVMSKKAPILSKRVTLV